MVRNGQARWLQDKKRTAAVGDIYRYAVGPLVSTAIASTAVKGMFDPEQPDRSILSEFPVALIARPVQLGASAGDAAQMMATAETQFGSYAEPQMLLAVMVGKGDKIVDANNHCVRLYRDIPGSMVRVVPHTGPKVHHTHPD